MGSEKDKNYLHINLNLAGGGAEKVALELVKGLSQKNLPVALLLFKDIHDYDLSDLGGVTVYPLLQPGDRILLNLHRLIPALISTCRKYDVLIAGLELWPSYITTIVGKLLRKKIVWTNHICLSQRIRMEGLPAYHKYLTRFLGNRADAVVAVSQGAADDLVRNFGIKPSAITVIHNPVNISQVQKLAEMEIPPEDAEMFRKPTVVSVGRLAGQKGFDILLRAMREVADAGVRCNTVLLGQGPDKESLRHLAQELGIDDALYMPGFKRNPFQYIARSTVFVLPSRFEGFGNVLVEAMACGRPVVAADCPFGPSEILSGGEFGILVPPEEPSRLAAGILSMLQNPERMDRYREVGLRRAQDFDTSVAVNHYLEVFSSL